MTVMMMMSFGDYNDDMPMRGFGRVDGQANTVTLIMMAMRFFL